MRWRYNPGDEQLRRIERRYTGAPYDWLSLQMTRMRRGLDYERTFIEKIKVSAWSDGGKGDDYALITLDPHQKIEDHLQTELVDHGDTMMQTFLNNGWSVETWADELRRPGTTRWATIIRDHNDLQIGPAIDCPRNCAISCHQMAVMRIINGTIEDLDEMPLWDAPPMYDPDWTMNSE